MFKLIYARTKYLKTITVPLFTGKYESRYPVQPPPPITKNVFDHKYMQKICRNNVQVRKIHKTVCAVL